MDTTTHGTWTKEIVLNRVGSIIFQGHCECGWVGSATYERRTAEAECADHNPIT